jgi:4-diphosphocytidyl-2-C-methyl-D-erythritol kinase
VALELIAPAKVNLVLEVTGRRTDGYHDIVSVMQTIDLADRVRLSEAAQIEIEVTGESQAGVPQEGPRNLAFAAARALASAAGRTDLGVHIELEKNIPAGMGLGGGSTDAAAVLRGLTRLWAFDLPALSDADLNEVAAGVGSDVPFFLAGGSAFVSGRGEIVDPLPDVRPLELTLFLCDAVIEDKTRRMYSLISPVDYGDGKRARETAESIRRGLTLTETDYGNVFDRHVATACEPAGAAMALCRGAGLAVLACGSGPAFFSPAPLSSLPEGLLRALERDWGVRSIACRSLAREQALPTREV